MVIRLALLSLGGYRLLAAQPDTVIRAPFARTTLDAKGLAERAVPNLTELLAGKSPGITVFRATSALGGGGVLRSRGIRSIALDADPILEVDGQVVPLSSIHFVLPALGSGSGVNIGRQSLLDLVDPENVESIEFSPGLGAGLEVGPSAANGVLRITTRRGAAGPTRWRWSSEAGVGWDPSDYGTTYYGFDPALRSSCGLLSQSIGACRIEGVYSRRIRDDPSLRLTGSGVRRKTGLSVAGGSSRLRYFAAARATLEDGVLGLPEVERDYLAQKLATTKIPTDRLTPDALADLNATANLDATVAKRLTVAFSSRLVVGRPRLPSSARGFDVGTLLEPMLYPSARPGDTATLAFGRPAKAFDNGTTRELFSGSVTARIQWEPESRKGRVWLRVGLGLLTERDVSTTADTVDAGNGQDTLLIFPTSRIDTTRYRDRSTQVDVGATWKASLGSRVALHSTVIGQHRRRAPRLDYAWLTTFGGSSAGSGGQIEPPGRTVSVIANEALTVGDNLTLVATGRRDIPEIIDYRPGATNSFAIGASWRAMTGPATLSLRGNLARVDRRPGADDGYEFGPFVPVGTPLPPPPPPERVREIELGASLSFGSTTIDLAGYDQRLSNGFARTSFVTPFGVLPIITGVGARLESKGLELSGSTRLIDREKVRWDLTVVATARSGRISELPAPAPVGNGVCHQVGASPYSICGQRLGEATDRNGDGIIGRDELPSPGPFGPLAPSLPRRLASLRSWVTVAGWGGEWGLGGQFDYAGGFESIDYLEAIRCLLVRCRAAVTAGSPLQDQVKVAGNIGYYANFASDASYGRLRDVTVSFRPRARWFGTSRMVLSVTGRNLATITGFPGLDPELRTVDGGTGSGGFVQPALSRSVTMRVALEWCRS